MKKLIFFISIFIFFSNAEILAQGVWDMKGNQNSNCKTIRDIDACSDNNIMAVGGYSNAGFFLKSTDGGSSWEESPTLENRGMYKIHFVDNQNIVAVGRGILRSSDGGDTWELIQDLGYFYDLHFINSEVGYAMESYGEIYFTTDGGVTWELKNVGFSNAMYAVGGFSNDKIFLSVRETGANGVALGGITQSNNSGNSWGSSIIFSHPIYDLFFTNETSGYGVGENGIYVSTTNGGITWTEDLTTFPSERLSAIYFLNEQIGFVVARSGSVFKTNDGGQNWQTIFSATGNFDLDIFALDNNNIFTAGNYGRINTTFDGGNNWTEPITGSESICATLQTTFVIDEQNVIAAGNAAVLYSEDGGETWLDANYPSSISNATFYDAECPTQNCFLASNVGIMMSNDQGKNWDLVTVDSMGGTIFDIHFAPNNPSIGYGVMGGGNMIKTTNGGLNWSFINFPADDCLLAVDFIDENIGWVVGSGGRFGKTNDGGVTWEIFNGADLDFVSAQYLLTGDLNDVHFVNESVGFIASYSVLLRTQNGGVTWDSITNIQAKNIHFIDENNGYAAGLWESIYHTVDGGDNWINEQPTGLNHELNSIHFADEFLGIAVGRQRILKQDVGVTYCIDSISGAAGTYLNVPIRARNFHNISSLQMEIKSSDPTVFKIVDTIDVALPGTFDRQVSNESLKVIWSGGSNCDLSLADDEPIFYVKIQLIGAFGTCAELLIDDTIFPTITYQCVGNGNSIAVPSLKKSAEICLESFVNICGTISMANGNGPKEEVEVSIITVPNLFGILTEFTDASGQYSMDVLGGLDGSITPQFDILWGKDVTSNDLAHLVAYLDGTVPWTEPWQIIAADVNNNGVIEEDDIDALTNLIFSPNQPIPNNTSWRFVRASDYPIPLVQTPDLPFFMEHDEFFDIADDNCEVDFAAIKVGDLDGNATLTSPTTTNSFVEKNNAFTFFIKKNKTEEIGVWSVDFYANDFENITSLQLELEFDKNLFSLEELVEGNLAEVIFSKNKLEEGRLPIVWLANNFDENGKTLSESDLLFSIKLKSKISNNAEISAQVTFPKINLVNENAIPALVFGNNISQPIIFDDRKLYPKTELSISPNPWNNSTHIKYSISQSSQKSQLLIRNINGVVVKKIEFDSGIEQSFELNQDQLSAGIYFLELIVDGKMQMVKKMIVIE